LPKKKGSGGLCGDLKKKHHWSEAKYKKCVTNSKRKHRRSRRRARSVNPWAVCSAQGLKRGSAKYERCVQHVKRSRRKSIWKRKGGKTYDRYGVQY
jgi:hypothetical protein